MDFNAFQVFTDYPFIFEGNLYDSIDLSQNKNCTKCKEKECILLANNQEEFFEFVCPKQYNCISINFSKNKFIINGIIYKNNKTIPIGRKEARLDWLIENDSITRFIEKIKMIKKYLSIYENEILEKKNLIYHDFKTSLSVFYNCIQDIINKLPGQTFEEKLKNSDSSYHDLYNSLELITSQLGMIDVIVNPKSIIFGKRKPINIYRFLEKIKILFGHVAVKKNITISLHSAWNNQIKDSLCYESIEFIPLILLDNAVKYSVHNSEIEIKLEQYSTYVKVLIKNIGPLVPDDNKEKIFEKFYRDETAMSFSKEGIGMGLWIAQQILEAHNSKLLYHKDTKATKDIGLNIFEFQLDTVD